MGPLVMSALSSGSFCPNKWFNGGSQAPAPLPWRPQVSDVDVGEHLEGIWRDFQEEGGQTGGPQAHGKTRGTLFITHAVVVTGEAPVTHPKLQAFSCLQSTFMAIVLYDPQNKFFRKLRPRGHLPCPSLCLGPSSQSHLSGSCVRGRPLSCPSL